MTYLELWLIAIGLAMDCFVIAISRGLMFKEIKGKEVLGISFLFGISPALLSFLGYFISCSFSHYLMRIDYWIVFIILSCLGIQMIWEYYKERGQIEPCKECVNIKVICLLALATSMDAFGIGISWALIGIKRNMEIFYTASVVGFASFLFTFIGLLFGYWSQKNSYYIRQIPVKLLGGLILLIIGGKVLLEHLSMHQ